MLAGEVGRVEPCGNRERLLHRVPAIAYLDKMVPDLTGLNPADGVLNVPLMQGKGGRSNIRF
jgi:hypothetical protein